MRSLREVAVAEIATGFPSARPPPPGSRLRREGTDSGVSRPGRPSRGCRRARQRRGAVADGESVTNCVKCVKSVSAVWVTGFAVHGGAGDDVRSLHPSGKCVTCTNSLWGGETLRRPVESPSFLSGRRLPRVRNRVRLERSESGAPPRSFALKGHPRVHVDGAPALRTACRPPESGVSALG